MSYRPVYVSTNTKNEGILAFLVLGVDVKGIIHVFDELYKETDESLSHVEAFDELIDWLTEVQENHDLPAGSKKWLQPKWILAESEDFTNFWRKAKRRGVRMTHVKETQLDQGIGRILTLFEEDNLKIKDCPRLREEIKKIGWEEKESFPVFTCLLNAINTLARSAIWHRIGKGRRRKGDDGYISEYHF